MNVAMVKAKRESKEISVATYYIIMAVDIILLYVLNNILNYLTHPVDVNTVSGYGTFITNAVNALITFRIPFVTEAFLSCLWAVNLALTAGIIGSFVLLLYRPKWFHHLVQVILAALTVLAVYIVYSVFPFSFEAGIYIIVMRAILVAIMACSAVYLVTELTKFIIAYKNRKAMTDNVSERQLPQE
jgi:hypothetical protein